MAPLHRNSGNHPIVEALTPDAKAMLRPVRPRAVDQRHQVAPNFEKHAELGALRIMAWRPGRTRSAAQHERRGGDCELVHYSRRETLACGWPLLPVGLVTPWW
jgi:hypothetical protein